jgi:NTE family protein
MSRALVLGGGGVAGIAWTLGVIDGLRRHGLDLGEADLIVGTSAGSCAGAVVATGALAQAVALQRRPETSEVMVPFDGEAYIATVTRLATDAPDPRTALMRIANMDPVGPAAGGHRRRRAGGRAGGL